MKTKWLCNACGKTFATRHGAYFEGCGTWSVEVLEDSIERNEAGRVVRATLAGEIHKVSVDAKVTT